MSYSIPATALTVIFVVTIVAIAGEILYVIWRRRSFRRRTSPPPHIPNGDQTPDFSSADVVTKELLYFFSLKNHTRVDIDPSGPPNKNPDRLTPDVEVVDLFKLLEEKGPSRFLCTFKEEDKEDVESKPNVDPTIKKECLQSDLQLAGQAGTAEEEVAVTVDVADGNTKTEFSTPCDSPLFYTPEGSPLRDFTEPEFVVSVHIGDDR